MMDNVVEKHPNVKIVATTLREVHSTSRHTWSAVAWINGHVYSAPQCELDVYDRVGGGDGFASGFILWIAERGFAGRLRPSGLGAWGLVDHVPR